MSRNKGMPKSGDVPGETVPGTYTNHPVGVLAWRRCPPDVRETGPTQGRYRMDWLTDVIEFIRQRPERFLDLVFAHLRLSFTSLAIAALIYLPLGVLFSRMPRFGAQAAGIFSAVRVIPRSQQRRAATASP